VSRDPKATADPPALLDSQDGQDGPYGTENLRVPLHSMHPARRPDGIEHGLRDNETWDPVVDKVATGDFYRREHRLISDAIRRQWENPRPLMTAPSCRERAWAATAR